jgi:hypothetical protein
MAKTMRDMAMEVDLERMGMSGFTSDDILIKVLFAGAMQVLDGIRALFIHPLWGKIHFCEIRPPQASGHNEREDTGRRDANRDMERELIDRAEAIHQRVLQLRDSL